MHDHGDVFELRTPSTDLGPELDELYDTTLDTPLESVLVSPLLASVRAEVEREARYAVEHTLEPTPTRVRTPRPILAPLPDFDAPLDVPSVGGEWLAGLAMLALTTGGVFVVLFGAVAMLGALLAP